MEQKSELKPELTESDIFSKVIVAAIPLGILTIKLARYYINEVTESRTEGRLGQTQAKWLRKAGFDT